MHLLPRHQGVGQGDAVHVLEIAAHGQAAREPGHPDRQLRQLLMDVGRGHFAFHRGIGRQDYLLHRARPHPVEKAIQSAGLGLNPITDGQLIRLPIPDLTEERRKELAKLVGQYAEKARIAVRNVRRDGMDHLKQDERKHEISEDERKRLEHEVQKLTDQTIAEIDAAAEAKEAEILGK